VNSPPERIRLAFLIRSLDVGGAERQLCTLVTNLDKDQFDVSVLVMYSGGALLRDLEGVPGVRVISLAKRGRWDLIGFGARLFAEMRRLRPQIVHGYMGGANELAWVFGRAVGARIVWGIRVSNLSPGDYIWSVSALFRLGALMSRSVDLIIANSQAGRSFHVEHGYAKDKLVVIPNGIDTDRFRSDPDAGRGWRVHHHLTEPNLVIGLPARLDPMKDHATFLRAVQTFVAFGIDAHFVCAGNGTDEYQSQLQSLARELGVVDCVTWIPALADPVPFYNGVDLVTISSKGGEGFPNVVGEAMACGVPCVATDVGDAALVIGDTGHLIEAGDHDGLAACWRDLCLLSATARRELGRRARARIVERFTPSLLARRTSEALTRLL